jgi:hypothetical protein
MNDILWSFMESRWTIMDVKILNELFMNEEIF